MKKSKNVPKRTLAALLIAATAAAGFCAPAFAEEAPVPAEEAYTVTEDEQGVVTITFNEPIILSRVEDSVADETEEEDGIMPLGSVFYDYIPEKYWGYYTSTAGNFTLSIKGENRIFFDGRYNFDGPNNFWHVFCYYDYVTTVYFYPKRNQSNGLMITYSQFAKITDSGNKLVEDEITITGWYEESNHTFVISGIIYHPEK